MSFFKSSANVCCQLVNSHLVFMRKNCLPERQVRCTAACEYVLKGFPFRSFIAATLRAISRGARFKKGIPSFSTIPTGASGVGSAGSVAALSLKIDTGARRDCESNFYKAFSAFFEKFNYLSIFVIRNFFFVFIYLEIYLNK